MTLPCGEQVMPFHEQGVELEGFHEERTEGDDDFAAGRRERRACPSGERQVTPIFVVRVRQKNNKEAQQQWQERLSFTCCGHRASATCPKTLLQHIVVLGPLPVNDPLAPIHHSKLPPILLFSKEDGHHKSQLQRKTTRLASDLVVEDNQGRVTRKLESFIMARSQTP